LVHPPNHPKLHPNMKLEKSMVLLMCAIMCSYLLYSNLSDHDQQVVIHLLDRMTNSRRSHARSAVHGTPQNLSVCPSVLVRSRFAFVTYIGINQLIAPKVLWYIVGACKLAQSLLRFSPEVDFVMLLAIEDGLSLPRYQQDMIEWSGWQICRVDFIASKNLIHHRFYDAKIFTKLHVFKLIEYEAIACIDSDMFAVQNASGLFYEIWPDMQLRNLTFAMALDYPRASTPRTVIHYLIGKCIPVPSHYNAGIFMLQPSLQTYRDLTVAMNIDTYDLSMCEQGLLNDFFRGRTYELPYKYNANLVLKACDPDFYLQQKSQIAILHFTVAKPWMTSMWADEWMWSCPWWHISEECTAWAVF